MKSLLLSIFCLFFSLSLFAQAPDSRLLLEGLVMNQSYKTLPNAQVVILVKRDTIAVISPNSKGVFRHLFRAGEKYKMIFEMDGYKSYTVFINTNGMSPEFDYDLTGMMIKLPKEKSKKENITKSEIFYEASFDSFVFKTEDENN